MFRCFLSASVLFASLSLTAQVSMPSGSIDPATAALAAKVAAAFSSVPPAGTQLTGTANVYAGSTHESGTFSVNLHAGGDGTFQLNAASLTRTETSGPLGDDPTCQWAGEDGIQHETAAHNCFLALNGILPVLTLQSQLPSLNVSAKTAQDANGSQTQELIVSRTPIHAEKRAAAAIKQLSTVTLSLDPVSFRLLSVAYNSHPEDDSSVNIPIVVRFSDYRPVNGVSVPFHIEKYLNNELALDLQVENAGIQ